MQLSFAECSFPTWRVLLTPETDRADLKDTPSVAFYVRPQIPWRSFYGLTSVQRRQLLPAEADIQTYGTFWQLAIHKPFTDWEALLVSCLWSRRLNDKSHSNSAMTTGANSIIYRSKHIGHYRSGGLARAIMQIVLDLRTATSSIELFLVRSDIFFCMRCWKRRDHDWIIDLPLPWFLRDLQTPAWLNENQSPIHLASGGSPVQGFWVLIRTWFNSDRYNAWIRGDMS